ncbi:aminotransferase [Aliidongia dinghuensis]|uniref:Aminotransferase n=1 Tax=Aliidongia dinghuensis TaxID=1867774 RepID=A0A8J2Z039_9PROT|nr:pyridoxal phosphate-dependent aminotransferase [Aliidongia dinghuensis]GGF44701.1 aminotransferase [Aliidongia dinghuensis]
MTLVSPTLDAPADGLAARMGRIAASPASILRRRARELRAEGRDVIELSAGDLDFPTPDHVVAAAHRAALAQETGYTDTDGTPALKDAVRAAFARQNGLSYGPDEIIVSTGSTQVLFSAFAATLEPGDEVIVPQPCWAPYLNQVRLAGGVPVPVACPPDNGFKLRPADLNRAITDRTRWVVLNNPVNPTGAVYDAADLSALARVLLDFPGIRVLADGLYEHIVFDGQRAPTMAEVEQQLKPRTLTVSGVAKAYGMEGWRIGYAGGPAPLVRAMAKVQSLTTGCPSSISQAAAVAALTGPQTLLAERAAELQRRRDRFAALLDGCAGLACPLPEGTFYLIVSCAGVIGRRTVAGKPIETGRDFAAHLLETAGVAVLAGEDCGLSNHVRVSFGQPMATLEEAARRIARACAELR